MPVADLYAVTTSLRNLVRFNIWRLVGLNITVTDLPPEKAEEAGNGNLNLHLFHANEDASKRNEFALDALGPYPIKETPLPLVLYYVMTAHGVNAETPDIAGQQRLMGLAMKTLHDFPSFDDTLVMPGPPLNAMEIVFDPAMRGNKNKIQIVPRQLSPEEAINFWSSAQNHTARLTAYYEVRCILLPADEIEIRAGLVTSYAIGVQPGGRPWLDTTTAKQDVILPAALGGGVLTQTVSPGQAAIGQAVTVTGKNLDDGDLVLAGPAGEVVLAPTANPDWQVMVNANSLSFVVQAAIQAMNGGAIAQVPLSPGAYAVSLRCTRRLGGSDGAERTSISQSNWVPFAISAAVTAVSVVAVPLRLRIDLAAGVDAQALEAQTELSIAGEVYYRHPPVPVSPLVAGEFHAVSASRIEAVLTFDPSDGVLRPVRLGIGGVDLVPFWVTP